MSKDNLHLFIKKAEELNNTRLLRDGFNPGFTINWNKQQGLKFSSRNPDEDDLKSYLLTFRQFILNDDPVYLYKIYKFCIERLSDNKIKDALIFSRKSWSSSFKRSGFNLIVRGNEIKPETALDWWINGHYFHNDSSKRSSLSQLNVPEALLTRHLTCPPKVVPIVMLQIGII